MSKFTGFLESKVMPVASRIAAQRHIRSLRDGLAITMPLIIVGSVFMILANIPVPGYQAWINSIIPNFTNYMLYPVRVTFDIMALLATFSVSYHIARDKNHDGLAAGTLALAAFLLLIPVLTVNETLADGSVMNLGRVFPALNMSASGLVPGLLTAIISTEIFMFVVGKNWIVKMPESVPPAVSRSFAAITPSFVILTLFLAVRVIFEHTPFETVFAFVQHYLSGPFERVGLSFGGMIGTVSAIHLFWSMGIHGARVVFGIMDSILLPAMDANRVALEAGAEYLPHIVTKQFHDIFVNGLGGSGSTLGLIIAMLWLAKSKQIKALGRIALGPALFNISEPIIFGIPIILNPIMMLPFIVAPIMNGVITYSLMHIGMVSFPAGIAIPWATPLGIGGFLATNGDIMGGLVQVLNVGVSFLIYLPFLKAYDRQLHKAELEAESES